MLQEEIAVLRCLYERRGPHVVEPSNLSAFGLTPRAFVLSVNSLKREGLVNAPDLTAEWLSGGPFSLEITLEGVAVIEAA